MKVYIGPYKGAVNCHQLADSLQKIGFSEDTCDRIGDWLDGSLLDKILIWFSERRDRRIKVKLHNYDTWNMDETVALIVLPLLKQLRDKKHGAPQVDDEDVPQHLRSYNAETPAKHEGDVDSLFFDRWDWVMDEMIFAFENHLRDWDADFWKDSGDFTWKEVDDFKDSNGDSVYELITTREPDVDWEGRQKMGERIQNGFRLFGKYYTGLWD
jgi:hypothetical protein